MTNLTFQSVAFQGVAFQPCEAFRAPLEHDEPVCAGCGHLAEDHEHGATVTQLRRRTARRASTPARKAS
jgi:hypothetical protein